MSKRAWTIVLVEIILHTLIITRLRRGDNSNKGKKGRNGAREGSR